MVEAGSEAYSFDTFELPSVDGRRHYQVQIATPRVGAPAAGYPVVYALDGNAAIAALDETLLARLAGADPPVIVAIGYRDTERFNSLARAYDYTPPVDRAVAVADPSGRPGGGAERFLDLLETRVMPEVDRRVRIAADRQTLWGQSYGGLLVLHAAFCRPGLVESFASASPSLWWNFGSILEHEAAVLKRSVPPSFALSLMVGEREQRSGRRRGSESPSMRTSLPPGATRQLANRLEAGGVPVHFTEFPDLDHGSMFPASLRHTLLVTAGVCLMNTGVCK